MTKMMSTGSFSTFAVVTVHVPMSASDDDVDPLPPKTPSLFSAPPPPGAPPASSGAPHATFDVHCAVLGG